MSGPRTTLDRWRVDVVFLTEQSWKYEGSGAKEGSGGRTHTFGVQNPATVFRNATAFKPDPLPGSSPPCNVLQARAKKGVDMTGGQKMKTPRWVKPTLVKAFRALDKKQRERLLYHAK